MTSLSKSDQFRWGLIGCGKISNDMALVLEKNKNATIVCCSARKIEKAKQFANIFDIPKYYGSYGDVAKDPNVDIVYIGTIHTTHFENIIDCLKNGKHVLCEKPCVINSNQLNLCLNLAKKNNLFFLEGMWTRFFPAIKQMKAWLHSGEIGDLISYRGSFGVQMPTSKQVPRLWLNELNGGSLLDIGIYCVHYLPLLFGNKLPQKLVSVSNINKEHNVDTMIVSTGIYNEKQNATICTNFYCSDFNEHLIMGTKGRIRLYGHAPTKIVLEKFDDNSTQTKEYSLPKDFRHSFNFSKSEGFMYQVDEVHKCVSENRIESPNYTWNDMKTTMQLMDEIRLQVGLKYQEDKKFPISSKI